MSARPVDRPPARTTSRTQRQPGQRTSRARTAAAAATGAATNAQASDAPTDTPATNSRATTAGPIVLDRYRLHRRLGTGAFATVWLARDERLERDVAVKILPRERILGGRFEREAKAAARLAHPSIVTLYEAAVDDEGAYLVSELVRGFTLDALLQAGRLSDRDIVAVAIALCEALDHAHGQAVIHRDVKPSNVLVPQRPATPEQIAKLTDFGVARVVGGDSLTNTGDVVGTAAYMAPEQAEGLDAGAAADLYSLALVLYEALTGVNPVRTTTAAQRARRLGAHMPPLRRQRRDLPRELGQAIDLALRPRPRERGSIAELREALCVAQPLMLDTPGVVSAPWPGRTAREREYAGDGARPRQEDQGARQEDHGARQEDARPRRGDHRPRQERSNPAPAAAAPWPARGLAALAGAALAAWLTSHVLSGTSIAPLVAALAAALLLVALPGVGWIVLAVALSALAAVQALPGAALVLLLAAAVPVAAMPRARPAWPLAAAAPALGLIGLGGAWPALAARAGTVWRRAALGITGWIWLSLAGPIAGADLYVRRPAGTPSASTWMPSLYETFHHMLVPILSSGTLAGGFVWAAAAAILPWLVRGRWLALDIVRVTVWSALLVGATSTAMAMVHASGGGSRLSGAAVGALAGAVVALAPTVSARWQESRGPTDTAPRLA